MDLSPDAVVASADGAEAVRTDAEAAMTSCAKIFGSDDLTPNQVSKIVGHGCASRTNSEPIEKLTRFFKKGEAVKNLGDGCATAVAVGDVKEVCGSNHPVHEMHFHNIGGTRIYNYFGLETVRSNEDTLKAGTGVRKTAIGVIMLDKYAIGNRPGDPSNPFTFWPYHVIYAVPQGVTFARCKQVGSAGANAAEQYPLAVTAICQSMMALAETAARSGYSRLMVVGDCGHFALATESFSKQVTCWGDKSWVPHPDGNFAAFRVPRFLWPQAQMEIVLGLGATQLIATPDPKHSLHCQLDNSAQVWLTADLCGWYNPAEFIKGQEGEKSLLVAEYDKLFGMWEDDERFTITMLDVVLRVNESIFDGLLPPDSPVLANIAERMVELHSGNTSYLVGMYLGQLCEKAQIEASDKAQPTQWVFDHICEYHEAVEKMVDDTEHSDFFNYLSGLMLNFANIFRKKANEPVLDKLTEVQEHRVLMALVGIEHQGVETYGELKKGIVQKLQAVGKSLLHVRDVFNKLLGVVGQSSFLPIGKHYVDGYAAFNLYLNQALLSRDDVHRTHAIDGRDMCLLDVRYVPGFGKQVADGLTVWTSCKNYVWMGAITGRFCELVQQQTKKPVSIVLECTELFSFTPFFEELGAPVVDAINLLTIASRCSVSAIRWVTFKQKLEGAGLVPQTPRALIVEEGGVFRDDSVVMRTPTTCASEYEAGNRHYAYSSILTDMQDRWRAVHWASPMFGNEKLLCGPDDYFKARPGETLYNASTSLNVVSYIPKRSTSFKPPPRDDAVQGSCQLASRKRTLYDEVAFFGEK